MASWTIWKWYLIAVTGITALFLTGIIQSISGYDLSQQLLGFPIKTILGIASGIGTYILYQKL